MNQPLPFPYDLLAAVVKIAVSVGVIMLVVPMCVWLERKVVADMQARVGPNRVGPFGLLQSFVDGIKLLTKEAILPTDVDKLLYFAAPVISMLPALAVSAVIPFGGDLHIGKYDVPLVIADIPVGFLYVLALTSLSVYGIVLSGWASTNKYSLLGGLRSSAQMVSYELPLGLSIVAGIMIASAREPGNIFSLSLPQVVHAQEGWFWNWSAFNPRFFFLGFIAMITFYIGGLAETNRTPFDLPEAESELVGGYHTEYSGMKWAMFFLGEYGAMLNVASMTTTLFLGGWHGPWPSPFQPGSIPFCVEGIFWFCLKIYVILWVYIWIRGTLPRLRYDRLMDFTWKRMLPATLANVLLIATILTAFYRIPLKDVPEVLKTAQNDIGNTAPTMRTPSMGGALRPNGPTFPGGGPAPSSQFPTGSVAPGTPGMAHSLGGGKPAPSTPPSEHTTAPAGSPAGGAGGK